MTQNNNNKKLQNKTLQNNNNNKSQNKTLQNNNMIIQNKTQKKIAMAILYLK